MTGARLAGTSAAMTGIATVLALLTAPLPHLADAVLSAQETADIAGAEALVVASVGLLAWAAWGWGALGLLLTAASALPGALGRAADLLVHVLLPAGARRGAALVLGVGLGITGPVAGAALLVATAPAATAVPAATAAPAATAVPDWPAAPATAPEPTTAAVPARPLTTHVPHQQATATVPDWPARSGVPDAPAPPMAGSHVVVRGDCLWDIAAGRLSTALGRSPTGAEIAEATRAWWLANAEVIGADPDVLLPGQVLDAPP